MDYKGQLQSFPKEIIEKMLEEQELQGNSRDITVFENDIIASFSGRGFSWSNSEDGIDFWIEVIRRKNFEFFFKKYPKQTPRYEGIIEGFSNSKFYMVYVQGGKTPNRRHNTYEEAFKECVRLNRKTGFNAFVLETISEIKVIQKVKQFKK